MNKTWFGLVSVGALCCCRAACAEVAATKGGTADGRERKLTLVAGAAFEGNPAGVGLRLALEGKLGRKVGLAGGAGASVIFLARGGDSKSDIGPSGTGSLSPRYYALGTYEHGMQLAAEVTGGAGAFKQFLGCLNFGSSDPCVNPERIRGFVALVPFVGYKYTAPVGFTVEVQAGIGAVASSGGVGPWTKGNVNVGWAF